MIVTILILIISVLIGILISIFLKYNKTNFIDYLLIYSGSFLLSFTCTELLPSIYYFNKNNIIYIFIGIVIQVLLEFITKGIEHGNNYYTNSISHTVIIGLFLHSFLEGIPISLKDTHLLYAIFIHNIPVAFLLSFFLFKTSIKQKYIYIILFIFSIGNPLGLLLGNYLSNNIRNKALAIVSGIFLYVSLLILYENNKKNNFKLINIICIIAGFISVIILDKLY